MRCRAFAFQIRRRAQHRTRIESPSIRVVLGGLREQLRFFHTMIRRSRANATSGQAVKSEAQTGCGIDRAVRGAMRLYDITTGTEDFIANGVVSHNCYARPSHAYMDLSPGIDFETKIFYKADAARLLEQELGRAATSSNRSRSAPTPIPISRSSANCRVTRSLLEVLERTRHPVSIVTKGTLILRDLDLLSLAWRAMTGATCSSASPALDAELKRTLEPRAASPQARCAWCANCRRPEYPPECWWRR